MYKGSLRRHVVRWARTHLSLGQHRHGLDAGQRPPRCPEALKPSIGPVRRLIATVVLLDPVVQPPPTPVPGEAPQLAVPLHLAQSAGIALQAIGHDGPRVAGVVPAERLAEEALGRLLVPLGAEHELDRLAGAVDGSVEIAPRPPTRM